tara:strand:- start:14721 stop:15557 length:837 start_codon:yes stop_codon:yes gene_type:complete
MERSKDKFKVGLIQMTSSHVMDDNIRVADELIRQAASQGAEFILTPEMTTLLDFESKQVLKKITIERDTSWRHFSSLAKELGVWLLIGSIAIKVGKKATNKSFLFSPEGKKIATYDKIHMFDVNLPGEDAYKESSVYVAGTEAVVASLPWGKVGLSICYDLRFPYLYRALSHAGAVMLTVPAAFTEQTGTAHWHTLLRARAIENGAFVFAPAQCGKHTNGRRTYGHSLIVDPWGKIISDGGNEIGVTVTEVNMEQVVRARNSIGSLTHDKNIVIQTVS